MIFAQARLLLERASSLRSGRWFFDRVTRLEDSS